MRIIATAAIAFAVLSLGTASVSAVDVGRKFPSFDAKDPISGKSFSLEDFRGKVVLIDFWATWCGPCVAELPNVKSAYDKYRDKGFEIISISLDSDKNKFNSFVQSRDMNWVHVMDGGGWGTRLAKKYAIRSIPAMYLVDDQGVCIAANVRGQRLHTEIEKALRKVKPVEPAPGDAAGEREPEGRAAAPADLRPALDAAVISTLQSQLAASRRELADAITPLHALAQTLETASQLARTIEADLPVPSRPTSTRDSYLRLREHLVELRRELFMLGLINDRTIVLPANPFAHSIDQRAFLQMRLEMTAANAALDQISAALASPRDQALVAGQALGEMRRELEDGRGDEAALRRRCDDLCAEAGAVADHWRDAWQAQLRSLHEVAKSMSAAGAKLQAEIEAAELQLNALRERLSPAPSDEAALNALKVEYATFCQSLRELADRVLKANPAATTPTRMPANPFERRTLRDRMLIPELEVQVRVAADVLASLRGACEELNASAEQEFQAIRPRIEALQNDLASATTPAAQLEVKARFAQLCDELLN